MSELKYPRKSHRKTIRIPEESKDLAEFLGIEMGDGGINNSWQVVITLNSIKDKEYSEYVSLLINKLFNIQVTSRKRSTRNALLLVTSSTTLVEYLVKMGAVKGNKVQQHIDIPKWISGKPEYEKPFVRGLVDTDGCLYIHNHLIQGKKYRNIGFCFTSFSKKLTITVANILTRYKIKAQIEDNGRRLYIYNQKGIKRYLEVFGSSNPRILKKYDEWRDRIVAECAVLERRYA